MYFPINFELFSKALFFIWSRLRCVYSTRTIYSTHTVCSTHTMSLWQTHSVPVWNTHSGGGSGGRRRRRRRRRLREYSGATPSPPSTHPHTPDIATLRCRRINWQRELHSLLSRHFDSMHNDVSKCTSVICLQLPCSRSYSPEGE